MPSNGIVSNPDSIEAEIPLFIADKYLYQNDINYESFDYIKKE